jgi:hypothetical protein
MSKLIESGRLFTETYLEKYSAEAEAYLRNDLGILVPTSEDYKLHGIEPVEAFEGPQPGNGLLTVGITQLWESATDNTTEQLWDQTHGAIGVGDSSTAYSAAQTDLQAASNKYYQQWTSAPSVSTASLIFVSTFGTSVANFAWNEYGVVIPNTTTTYTSGTSKQASYVMLNRKAGASLLGTKTSAQSWVFTVTLTLS